ncbi:O-antigen ligase family protein [Alphaproteobacteria bacterium]|nr:O-antigen ligase family protein [Alphaproteobacteria bacterium]
MITKSHHNNFLDYLIPAIIIGSVSVEYSREALLFVLSLNLMLIFIVTIVSGHYSYSIMNFFSKIKSIPYFILFLALSFNINYDVDGRNDWNLTILKSIYMCVIFLWGAYYTQRFDRFKILALFAVLYSTIYLAKNLMQPIDELINGYHSSLGHGLYAVMPFIYIYLRTTVGGFFSTSLALGIILFLAIVGARTHVFAIIGFLLVIFVWPRLSNNKFFFYVLPFSVLFFFLALTYFYIQNVSYMGQYNLHSDNFNIFNKNITSRYEIWRQLYDIILSKPLLGHGIAFPTHLISTEGLVDFRSNRSDLSSHSTYLEILFRTGVLGMVVIIGLMALLLVNLYKYSDDLVRSVAYAALISSLIVGFADNNIFFPIHMIDSLIILLFAIPLFRTSYTRSHINQC